MGATYVLLHAAPDKAAHNGILAKSRSAPVMYWDASGARKRMAAAISARTTASLPQPEQPHHPRQSIRLLTQRR
ncbi:hypothetical protein C0Z16_26310 [Paraburkholderia rhynchosiae]|uniref:Uncharacterized protein n=1 Tax=Paraburkholderia rhynchosiae TaxID=487049 RepID=A0ABX4V0G8_9BURK|nr:hypothetical protein C0Z16_26310 [Paraburkholderia rhynchosiae]